MGKFLLALGSILSLLFIVFLVKGKKYEYTVENLEEKKYPLKDIYIVGFAWSDTKVLQLRGKMYKKLKEEALLLYGDKYSDYYARLTWAQTISVIHLFTTFIFLLAGFADAESAGMLLLVAVLIGAAIAVHFLDAMKKELKERSDECVLELPDMISKLALLVNSGMIMREAWTTVANSNEGKLYELMRTTCEAMENGESDSYAIYQFGVLSNVSEIKKFASALMQSVEKGSSDLTYFLIKQSSEMWTHKKQIMLQKGEVAASKLVAPIALMFVGILIIILTAALSGMAL